MQYAKSEKGYLIRLFKSEKIIETLTKFCESNNIASAVLNGIGGALSAELGYYDLLKKEYFFKKFDNLMEIVSLSGNVSKVDRKPFLHIHTVLSDDKFNCFGGHLKEATVGATCEIYLTELGFDVERKLDDDIGLALLDCPIKI